MEPHSILKDPGVLDQMLGERKAGASLLFLANRYKVHHTTIMLHCKRNGAYPPNKLVGGLKKGWRKQPPIVNFSIPEGELDPLQKELANKAGLNTNKGKSYYEYVQESLRQKEVKDYFKRYGVNPLDRKYMRRLKEVSDIETQAP